ncbi:VTT domain-containing protein [Aliiglaciecola litoralis]|uniref:TVP38/TMEM64 family membrane protein n=1 Tax=Aliiglaciecola litoralis TaxID=582857 RepID=A0ABP3WQS8_9ALTE
MNYKKIAIVAVVICVIAGLYFLTPLRDYLSIDKITEVTNEVPESFSTALIFLAVFTVGGALLVPIPLIAFAVSLVFNIWVSLLIVFPGFLLASLSGYGVGRLIDTSFFGKKVENNIDKIKSKLDDKGAWAVMALRLAPTPPFTITSMICGTMKLNIVKYAIGSAIGIAPLSLSAMFFGKGALEMIKEPSGIALSSLVAAVILYAVYFVIKRQQGNDEQTAEG